MWSAGTFAYSNYFKSALESFIEMEVARSPSKRVTRRESLEESHSMIAERVPEMEGFTVSRGVYQMSIPVK